MNLLALVPQLIAMVASGAVSDPSVAAGLVLTVLSYAVMGHNYARLSLAERRMKGESAETLKKSRWTPVWGYIIAVMTAYFWLQRFVLVPT
jgi:hypothetical protein